MKLSLALSLALAGQLALAQRTTTNDCLEEQEAEFLETCRNLFYPMCDVLNILPLGSCNVITFGDASITWFS